MRDVLHGTSLSKVSYKTYERNNCTIEVGSPHVKGKGRPTAIVTISAWLRTRVAMISPVQTEGLCVRRSHGS
ncbi:hypothetical protein HMPREF1316_2296 [Olsenella profusa F0195]|uniref:Uncharacterized protein n=1 Tax=Olsenella profusa F0195 TaxID=1125712 RepID=U2V4A4_9ACTN|nr:hypothetical protein HMPREF1316_2296 [Olsenella profusa F0195]